LFGVLAVFFPLGLYLLAIGRLNRRPHPVLVAGPVDFLGVLLGLSGMLLYLGPRLLAGFHSRWRDIWLDLHFLALRGPQDEWALLREYGWYLYFAVIIAGSLFLLWQRRHATVVYNVNASAFRVLLFRVLDRLGFEWSRSGHRITIHPRAADPRRLGVEPVHAFHSHQLGAETNGVPVEQADDPFAPDPPASAREPAGSTVVEVMPFSPLRHVTLHWREGAEPSRRPIEAELARALAAETAAPSPVAAWFTWLGTGLFLGLFFLTVLIRLWVTRAGDF
jgi:hypothetical protein